MTRPDLHERFLSVVRRADANLAAQAAALGRLAGRDSRAYSRLHRAAQWEKPKRRRAKDT